MSKERIDALGFEKLELVPAVVQDQRTLKVLMVGYMNREALKATHDTGKVTFYSRSKERLWVKGETSGNFLLFKSAAWDCDQDALLVMASPVGPVCHTGSDTCFGETNVSSAGGFLRELEETVVQRLRERPAGSYITSLAEKGIFRIAQKVGEEGVETALEAVKEGPSKLLEEVADLFFHILVLLQYRGSSFQEVLDLLETRSNPKP